MMEASLCLISDPCVISALQRTVSSISMPSRGKYMKAMSVMKAVNGWRAVDAIKDRIVFMSEHLFEYLMYPE